MGKLFRGKMLDALVRAADDGKLRVNDSSRFAALVSRLYRKNWNVYSKRPFGGAEQVLAYLGQYTHRVAISNQRLLTMDDLKLWLRRRWYRPALLGVRLELWAPVRNSRRMGLP